LSAQHNNIEFKAPSNPNDNHHEMTIIEGGTNNSNEENIKIVEKN
jgi:hypothetical protein